MHRVRIIRLSALRAPLAVTSARSYVRCCVHLSGAARRGYVRCLPARCVRGHGAARLQTLADDALICKIVVAETASDDVSSVYVFAGHSVSAGLSARSHEVT